MTLSIVTGSSQATYVVTVDVLTVLPPTYTICVACGLFQWVVHQAVEVAVTKTVAVGAATG